MSDTRFRKIRVWGLTGALALAMTVAACGDGGETVPVPEPDMQVYPDFSTAKLYDCETPGEGCNPHDSCALNSVCGDDKKCHPTGYQNCDDGLSCTDDTCMGQGLCEHKPVSGKCAIFVKVDGKSVQQCFNANEPHPDDACQLCDPTQGEDALTSWSPKNGGTCDDGNDCTKDDYCQSGTCAGTPYGDKCADGYSCTTDKCDGKGGCLGFELKANACLINEECYIDQQQDNTGCNICEVAQSQTTWTPLGTFCMIDGKCYKPGDKDSINCAQCDPTVDDKAWTPLAGVCKIGSACYQPGDKHSGLCAECDPSRSATEWTVKGDECLIDDVCYKPADKDSINCAQCDPTTDKKAWTSLAGLCKIGGACYSPGDQHTGLCAECDPTASSTEWTVKGSDCLIEDKCYATAATDTTGCGVCDPTADKKSWSTVANKCKIGGNCYADAASEGGDNCLLCTVAASATSWSPGATSATLASFDFEGNALPSGWTVTATGISEGVTWSVFNKRTSGGAYSLYYGNPVANDYETSGSNSGSIKTADIALAAGKKAGIRFWLYLDTESGSSYDTLDVNVVDGASSKSVWSKDSSTTQEAWHEIYIDLSAYAGNSIKIDFAFDTTDSFSNTGEGVYIDDIVVYHDC